MKKPDIPQDEKTRLDTLRSLSILDTSEEERFDRLTRLAKRMFAVPIALVSFVDENRQWFKSCVGLNVSETPRDISFCGHSILGDDIFIVNDASLDERFADNPLVVDEPYVRFYAGCPLKHLNGSKLGTLCIIDHKPRFLCKEDLDTLRDLAELAERELAAVQLATIDDLTKISNRRGFILLAQSSLSLCRRREVSASLVFLDLNGFKRINDNYGHAEGDRALIEFANQMRITLRDSDIFARLGGDEFVLLLANTDFKKAQEVVVRFREAVDYYNQKVNRGYDIAFSEGIVMVKHDQIYSIEELLDRADSLMYEKKINCNNDVV